jgi:hypothetical protein
MAQVFYSGQVQGCQTNAGFGSCGFTARLSLASPWTLVETNWALMTNDSTDKINAVSQTHCARSDPYGWSEWSHPLDSHYHTTTLQHPPRLLCEVYELDDVNRLRLAGYAVVPLPITPGRHELEASMWRPAPTGWKQWLEFRMLGVRRYVRGYEWVDQREGIKAESVGCIRVSVDVVTRGMEQQGWITE